MFLTSVVLFPLNAIAHPNDEYHIATRKLVFTILLYVPPVALLLWGVTLYHTFQDVTNHEPANIGAIVALGPGVITLCIAPYAWVRMKGGMSELAMDLWMLGVVALIAFASSCLMTHTLGCLFVLTAFIVIACQPKSMKFHLGFVFWGYSLWLYNVTVFDKGFSDFALRLDGALDAGTCEPIIGIASAMTFLVLIGGLLAVVKEYNSTIHKSRNTAELCYAVSEKMLIYDVEGANELLRNAVDVDERMTSALSKMLANLELFRPHLPEYVWHRLRKGSRKTQHRPNSAEKDNNCNTNSNNVVQELPLSPLLTVEIMKPSEPKRHEREEEDDEEERRREEDSPSTSLSSLTSTKVSSMFAYFGPETVDHAFFALIDYKRKNTLKDFRDATQIAPAWNSGSPATLAKPSSVRKLVNWAHTHALKSRGNLHAFIGDTIQVTWTFQTPSSRPALFLLRMYDTFNSDNASGLRVAGSLCSGAGTSYMAGDRRQALILHLPWRDVLPIFHKLARENNAALLDEHSVKCSRGQVSTRWVDVVAMSPGKELRIFELLEDISDSMQQDVYDNSSHTEASVGSEGGVSSGEDVPPIDSANQQFIICRILGLKDSVSLAMEAMQAGQLSRAFSLISEDTRILDEQSKGGGGGSTMAIRLHTKILSELKRGMT
eukprot:PhF_6_TR13418/c0_g1_i3/m.21378